MSCGLYAVWTAGRVASIISRRGRVKARREPERSAFFVCSERLGYGKVAPVQ